MIAFEDRAAFLFSMVLTTDEDVVVVSIVGSVGEDKVVVEIVDDTVVIVSSGGDPHVTLRFPFNPPEIQVTRVI